MKQRSEEAWALVWAMCKEAEGGGKGKCDPDHCACGDMADGTLAALHDAGYVIHQQTAPAPPFECPECHADLAIATYAFGCGWTDRKKP